MKRNRNDIDRCYWRLEAHGNGGRYGTVEMMGLNDLDEIEMLIEADVEIDISISEHQYDQVRSGNIVIILKESCDPKLFAKVCDSFPRTIGGADDIIWRFRAAVKEKKEHENEKEEEE